MTMLATAGSRVLAALETVRDPELDEPITVLGFVSECAVDMTGQARVTLRLPTYFCAPNFAYLMAADAYDAVSAIPGVRSAQITLADHFAADLINRGVAARAGFARSFAGEAAGELDELRADFLRKAVMAGTDQVCRLVIASGTDPAVLADLTLGDVPPSPPLNRLRQRRAELGLATDDAAVLLIDPSSGEPVSAADVPLHLRKARTVRVGVEANTGICRGMLRHRYDAEGLGEAKDPSAEEDR